MTGSGFGIDFLWRWNYDIRLPLS